MADHFSGPRALSDPAADVTDVFAFPSPDRPGHLVVVLDVNPGAGANTLFSDAITYRFRVRPVTATSAGTTAAISVSEDEYDFDFTFAAPVRREGTDTLVQAGTCITPGGDEISFQVGDEEPTGGHGVRIFAGLRLEPFFIDVPAEIATQAQEQLAFHSKGTNTAEGWNVLSIILEVDPAALFSPGTGSLLTVVGETLTSGHPVRLERMGRPEIKNFILQGKQFDTVNRDLEIRDLYNSEDAFNLGPEYLGAYRSRMNANLAHFDRIDGKMAWPLDDQGTHPLTELLLADFLVVDISKPYLEDSFLEIERALLASRPHATCGGRSLNDDIVDTLYTFLVGGIDGPRISDGVDQATRPATRTFPYLNSPNPDAPDLAALGATLAPPKEAA